MVSYLFSEFIPYLFDLLLDHSALSLKLATFFAHDLILLGKCLFAFFRCALACLYHFYDHKTILLYGILIKNAVFYYYTPYMLRFFDKMKKM